MAKSNKTKEQMISEMDELRHMIGDFQSQDSSYKKLNDQLQAEITERKKLQEALRDEVKQRQDEVMALLKGARAIQGFKTFQESARHIFDCCKTLIGATAGYVALLSSDGAENEVLFLDAGGRACTVDPDLPMPIRGLRSESYHFGKTVYDNDFHNSEWMKFMPGGHVKLDNVMFAPLKIEEKTVGLIGIANKPGGFTENDVRLATAFGEFAAASFVSSRSFDELEVEVKARTIELSRINTSLEKEIADHKKAEETIQAERQRFFALLEGLPAYVYLQASDHSIRFANRYYRKQFGDTEGMPCYKSLWGRDKPCEVCPTFKVFDTGEPQVWEWTQTPDGRCYEVYDYPFTDIDGTKLVLEMGTDITKRKQAEADREKLLKTLADKNKELQSVVYIASHDLKSPLVTIAGFSNELNNSCKDIADILKSLDLSDEAMEQILPLMNEDIPESLKFISASVEKMKILLDGLLRISRIGTVDINIESLDMNHIVNDVCQALGFQFKEKDVEVVIEDLPECLGDGKMIDQLFSNLVGNALKYLDSDKEGKIHISGTVDGPQSIYCVEDNGIGIASEHQLRVFELFHRLKPDNSVEGEGLGLTIVTRILERNHGSIHLESKESQGSKFFVSLPNEEEYVA